ncbi:MAG: hypothetical protein IJD91_07635 [Clostridia bacterium]|nr:hypothetical protein [Clostridia bacterium]
MTIAENWTKINWHCANCGNEVTGYQEADGRTRAECNKCKTVMVRSFKSRRRGTIELYRLKEKTAV